MSCSFRRSCFVGEFDEEGVKRFSAALHRFAVRGTGRAIFNQGEPADCCYFLCDGLVKLTRVLKEGDEVILDVLSPPNVLGKGELLQRSVQFHSAVTLSETVQLAYFKTESLLNLLKDYPSVMQRLLIHLKEQTEKVYKLLACMRLRVRERLLSVIALNVPMEGDTPVAVPFSNVDLAQLTQTTPETISRVLSQLQAENRAAWNASGILTIKASTLREYLEQFD